MAPFSAAIGGLRCANPPYKLPVLPAIITLSGNYAPVARPGHLRHAVESIAFSALAHPLQCLP
jgi:hypothetical protein